MLERIENDDPALNAALRAEDLPTIDLVAPNKLFWRWVDGGLVVGHVGIELHGDTALLRSLVVDKAVQRRGLGRKLVAAAAAEAKTQGIQSLWLLTKTAQPFFERLGWQVVDRSIAPALIAQSEEFTSLCPASATCLMFDL